MKKRIFFRADGSPIIGYGHIFRVLALSEMIKDDFKCILVTNNADPFVMGQVNYIGIECIEIPSMLIYPTPNQKEPDEEIPFDMDQLLRAGDIVVTDGYWFGIKYQYAIKQIGCFLICIDDLTSIDYSNADVIINHAPGIEPTCYTIGKNTKLCLGLDYLILRQPFFVENLPIKPKSTKVYIAFGAADHFSITPRIVEKCLFDQVIEEIHVLTSEAFNKDCEEELLLQKSINSQKLFLYKNLDALSVIKLIDSCTHAILAASTVALEVISRKVKPLIGYYTDNQIRLYNGLINEGYSGGLGDVSQGKIEDKLIFDYVRCHSVLERRANNSKLTELFLSL